MRNMHIAGICGEVFMFESVKQGGHLNAKTYFASLLFSIITHAAILGTIVSLPLIFCSPLSPINPMTWVIDSPVLSGALVPPPPPPLKSGKRSAEPPKIYEGVNITPPLKIPDGVPLPDEDSEPVVSNWLESAGYVPGTGISAQGPSGHTLVSTLLPKAAPPILPPPEPPRESKVIPVSSSLQESKLIFKVDPIYPGIAIHARVSGTVILVATIDEEGNVTDLKVLAGHPLLTKSAVEAVSRWKYSPTILNGEPVKVSATVTVVFRIR
jgi:protein TonB